LARQLDSEAEQLVSRAKWSTYKNRQLISKAKLSVSGAEWSKSGAKQSAF